MPQVYVHFSVLSLDNDVLYTTSASDGGSGQPLAFVLAKGCRAPRAWELAVAGKQQAAWPSHTPRRKLALHARPDSIVAHLSLAACSLCRCPFKLLGSDAQNLCSQALVRGGGAAIPVKLQSSAEADCCRNGNTCYCSIPKHLAKAPCCPCSIGLGVSGLHYQCPVLLMCALFVTHRHDPEHVQAAEGSAQLWLPAP